MVLTGLKRIIKSGFISFWRNGMVSFACVLVMVVTLLIIGSLILGSAVLNSSIELIKDRVDVNIYFKTDAKELDILAIKDSLIKLPEVKLVSYTTKEEALEKFKEKHKNNSLIISSLEELRDNPLGAILSIKARDPSQYESITKFLETDAIISSSQGLSAGDFGRENLSIIDKVNFYQNKLIIDRLSLFIKSGQKLGFIVSLIFVLIAALVTFNTIRLAIYTNREEISIMKLVGASNLYIRGPFITSGIMYGIISAVFATIIFYPITKRVGLMTENFFGGLNIYQYYLENIFQIFGILVATGIILGAVSSYMAARRYLHL